MTDLILPNNPIVKIKKPIDLADDVPQYLTTNITKPIYKIGGFLNNHGFCIKKYNYHEFIINFLRLYYNFKPEKDFEIEGSDDSFDVFTENSTYIILPKFTADSVISSDKDEKPLLLYYENNDNTQIVISNIVFKIKKISYEEPKQINIVFKGILRDYQEKIIENILEKNNEMNEIKGGIIVAGCGSGKTLMTIALACILKKKVLVVTYQGFLMNQWIKQIQLFTDAKVGKIKGNIIDTENCDFVIGSLKSIACKDYDKNLFKQFGVVIYDEVHRFGSKIYSNVFKKTSCMYNFGLSATLARTDGADKLIKMFIGPILVSIDRKLNYKILVKKVYFRSNSDKFVEQRRRMPGCKDKVPDNTSMIQSLSEIESRNKLIIDILTRLKDDGRKIFVFSSRVEHLIYLKHIFDEALKANDEYLEIESDKPINKKNKKKNLLLNNENNINQIENNINQVENKEINNLPLNNENDDDVEIPIKKKITTSLYYAKTTESQRQIASDSSALLFCTIQIAQEGLDVTRMDTIVYALPCNKLSKTTVQSSGRILRSLNLENYLKIPVIIDISDLLSIYTNWSKIRDEVYLKKKWYVQEFYWNDNNFTHTPQNANLNPMDIMLNDIKDEEFITNNLILEEGEDEEEFEEVDNDRNNMFEF